MADEELARLNQTLTLILEELRNTRTTNPKAASETGAKESLPTLADLIGHYMQYVLRHTRGNKQAAARILAVDRKTLDRQIKRHNIENQVTFKSRCFQKS